jgi:hypothetical protein
MKLNEQINKIKSMMGILNEEVNKVLIYRILRRLPYIEERLEFHMNWILHYYEQPKIKQLGLNWFIETLIYNLWMDDISPIFEDYSDITDEFNETLSIDNIDYIKNYIKTHFKDKIETIYNNFIK